MAKRKNGIEKLKDKLMAVQEDLDLAGRHVRASQRRNFRYNDIWRKHVQDAIEAASHELEEVIGLYQKMFEDNGD